jgi:hypothetical protein
MMAASATCGEAVQPQVDGPSVPNPTFRTSAREPRLPRDRAAP